MEATVGLLDQLMGSWRGSVTTWQRPDEPGATSEISGTFEPALGGRTVLYLYTSMVGEHRSDGMALIGKDITSGGLRMTWVDTFHTMSDVMTLEDCETDDGLGFLGSYSAGDQTWGWRIVLRVTGADELMIEHFNILPTGEEPPAVEIKYRRT